MTNLGDDLSDIPAPYPRRLFWMEELGVMSMAGLLVKGCNDQNKNISFPEFCQLTDARETIWPQYIGPSTPPHPKNQFLGRMLRGVCFFSSSVFFVLLRTGLQIVFRLGYAQQLNCGEELAVG